ncbi:hypothetical protein RM549_03015 [Salegentibacter sp. F188]|uniref:Uncharacterized protein n=1 Tax=Autumnicola patrickiae TaxID=3075591 RepID=A0ABU3DYC4_9FLAO|nr:hypothetical protein [Salegentibacter sp. F188]MDT0688736.1 hypothetical protein [Salegentibacter sp. F188]
MEEKSFLKKASIDIEDYGTSVDNPVLVNSIAAGRSFCTRLAQLDEDMEYERRGSTSTELLPKPVDIYDFNFFGRHFCTIYVYAYHSTNIEEVPLTFHDLERMEELAMDAIFNGYEEEAIGLADVFHTLVASYLLKNGIDQYGCKITNEKEWAVEDQELIDLALLDLGKTENIEKEIMREWNAYAEKSLKPHCRFFINEFIKSYSET